MRRPGDQQSPGSRRHRGFDERRHSEAHCRCPGHLWIGGKHERVTAGMGADNEVLGQVRNVRSEDIAVSTNVDILRRIVGVPVISGLAENMSELPPEWEQITRCLGKSETSDLKTSRFRRT